MEPSPAMKRRRGLAPPPAATGQQHPTTRSIADREMLLLFETPFGFALFNFHATLIEQPNALEKIWTHFTCGAEAKKVVWLREFRIFEDKSSAINQDTGVNQSLTQMILKYHCPAQRMAVAKPEYKKIIEDRLICFASFVPSEDWYLTDDDLLPMSPGLQNVLTRYGCNLVNPEMVNERIVMVAHVLFQCDSFENEKSGELHHAAALIKDVSGIDTDNWGLRKIATALNKIWCIERAGKSCKISEDEVSRLVSDADKYEVKLDKDACLKVSRQMLQIYGFRAHIRKLLKECVEQAKEAYEAE